MNKQEMIDNYNEMARATYFYTVDHRDATLAQEFADKKKKALDLLKANAVKFEIRLIEEKGRERLYQLDLI